MSTNIYNAYCIDKKLSLKELDDIVKLFREDIQKEYERMFYTNLSIKITEILDMLAMEKDINQIYKYLDIYEFNTKRGLTEQSFDIYPFNNIEKLSKDDNSRYNIKCELIFYFLEDKVLFQVLTDINSYLDLFGRWEYDNDNKEYFTEGKYDFVKEYSYWNNSDKLEAVSDEEWKERETNWNEVFKEKHTLKEVGYIVDPTPNIIPEGEKLVQFSLEERAEKWAKRVYFYELVNIYSKKNIYSTIEIVEKAENDIELDISKKPIEKHKKRIMKKLKEKITMDDMLSIKIEKKRTWF